jgi:Arc/MetJ-type ribon-helix-helix transcriptional regulator
MSSPSLQEFEFLKFDEKWLKSLPPNDLLVLASLNEKVRARVKELQGDTQRREDMAAKAKAKADMAALAKERGEDTDDEMNGGRSRRHKKTKRSTKKRRHTRRR